MKKYSMFVWVIVFTMTLVFIQGQAYAESDFLNMSWDEIVTAAKAEGSVTFYTWWGEEFWKSAAASTTGIGNPSRRNPSSKLTSNLKKNSPSLSSPSGTSAKAFLCREKLRSWKSPKSAPRS